MSFRSSVIGVFFSLCFVANASPVFIFKDFIQGEIPHFEISDEKDPRAVVANLLEDNIYLDPALSNQREVILKFMTREFAPSVLSFEKAQALFEEVRAGADPLLGIIDWKEKRGGCNHRVRQLSRWLREKKIRHEDVYLGRNSHGNLRVKKDPTLSWPFHNAIVLTVEDAKEGVQKRVIDLALSPTQMLSLNNWTDLMDSNGEIIETVNLPYSGMISGHAKEENVISIRPAEFDEFWDSSELMCRDRQQCIEQDRDKI